MNERKKLKIQEIINEFSNLAQRCRLKIASKQKVSAWDFETEAGAILIKAFRLGCFESDGRLNRIIASFHTKTNSQIDYRIIFQTVCEKYLTNHKSGFDFEIKRHQFGLDKALISAVEWFINYLIAYQKRTGGLEDLMKFAGAVSRGNPRSADNKQIDADLAKE